MPPVSKYTVACVGPIIFCCAFSTCAQHQFVLNVLAFYKHSFLATADTKLISYRPSLQ